MNKKELQLKDCISAVELFHNSFGIDNEYSPKAKIDQKEILRQNTIEEISKDANLKNTYILSSIISQILSLLFLLILFRVLIANKL